MTHPLSRLFLITKPAMIFLLAGLPSMVSESAASGRSRHLTDRPDQPSAEAELESLPQYLE